MSDDQRKHSGPTPPPGEFLAKCEECGQLYDRANSAQVSYHEHPGHKPRQRHNLPRISE